MKYIPQQAPFVMVDEVLRADEKYTQTSFAITADNVLVSGGYLTEGGLIENMAQTAAAGTGYRAAQEGRAIPGGYIAALKNVNITALPKVNETIITEITYEQAVMNFHLVTGRVTREGKEMASCAFKILVEPEKTVLS